MCAVVEVSLLSGLRGSHAAHSPVSQCNFEQLHLAPKDLRTPSRLEQPNCTMAVANPPESRAACCAGLNLFRLSAGRRNDAPLHLCSQPPANSKAIKPCSSAMSMRVWSRPKCTAGRKEDLAHNACGRHGTSAALSAIATSMAKSGSSAIRSLCNGLVALQKALTLPQLLLPWWQRISCRATCPWIAAVKV